MPKAAQLSTLPKTAEAPLSHPQSRGAVSPLYAGCCCWLTHCVQVATNRLWWMMSKSAGRSILPFELFPLQIQKQEYEMGRKRRQKWEGVEKATGGVTQIWQRPGSGSLWWSFTVANANLFLSSLSMWCYFWQWRPGNQDEPVQFSSVPTVMANFTSGKTECKMPRPLPHDECLTLYTED